MKTPRDLLLSRHRDAEPELDAIRRAALATLKVAQPESLPFFLLDWLRSLRWHFASLSVIWVFILFLHANTGRAPSMMASIPSTKPASPQVIMASLRENRRQLYEMIEPNLDSEPRKYFVPKPRSDRRTETAIA